jgi:hypothetical protein
MGTAKQRLMKTLPVNESVRTSPATVFAQQRLFASARSCPDQVDAFAGRSQLARCFIWTARSRAI